MRNWPIVLISNMTERVGVIRNMPHVPRKDDVLEYRKGKKVEKYKVFRILHDITKRQVIIHVVGTE